MAITVYFVRHGQTYLNRYHRVQGWSDAPLTSQGKTDAKRTGKVLSGVGFDYLFSSDLARTMETARLLLAASNNSQIKAPTPTPAFREEFFGFFEGLDSAMLTNFLGAETRFDNFADMFSKLGPDTLKDRVAAADPYKDAENHVQFWNRVSKGIDHLRSLPDGSTAVVVSHGVTIRSIAEHYGYHTTESVKNGSMTRLTLTTADTHVDFYNQLELPE